MTESLQSRITRHMLEKSDKLGRMLTFSEFQSEYYGWLSEHPEIELEDDPDADMPGFRG